MKIKKIVSILLAIVIMFALTIPAYAADLPATIERPVPQCSFNGQVYEMEQVEAGVYSVDIPLNTTLTNNTGMTDSLQNGTVNALSSSQIVTTLRAILYQDLNIFQTYVYCAGSLSTVIKFGIADFTVTGSAINQTKSASEYLLVPLTAITIGTEFDIPDGIMYPNIFHVSVNGTLYLVSGYATFDGSETIAG